MGDFKKPDDRQSTGREKANQTNKSSATGVAIQDCGGHSHRSLCPHTTPQIVGTPPFNCYPIMGPRGGVSRQDWRRWAGLDPHAYRQMVWYCSNIAEAAQHYSWREFQVGGVPIPFDQLAQQLQHAMNTHNIVATRAACESIFRWGGLTGVRTPKDALNWIATGSNLITDIRNATDLIRPGSKGNLAAFDGKKYLMDSAMTKVYAAAALTPAGHQEVLMYDGRVGSALCLLVRQFITKSHGGLTPAHLGLDFLRDRGQLRDPSQLPGEGPGHPPNPPGIHFSAVSNNAAGHRARAERARLAAQVIQCAFGIATPSWQFTEMEKGLFMIGYNVRTLCCGCPRF